MLIVALTGGIGSGKSSVSLRFEQLGIPILDADIIAREQVLPGSPALDEIKTLFGPQVITLTGELDRTALRAIVFNEPEKRRRLEQILHPRIRNEMERRLQSINSPYAVLVIPLLLETGQNELADRILVVDCPMEQQISRVRQRDGLSEAQINQILGAQTNRAARLKMADDVIDNSGSLEDLMEATDRMHQFYLELTAHSG